MHCYIISDKRKRVELGSESSLADKDGDGYIEPFNVNPNEYISGGGVIAKNHINWFFVTFGENRNIPTA